MQLTFAYLLLFIMFFVCVLYRYMVHFILLVGLALVLLYAIHYIYIYSYIEMITDKYFLTKNKLQEKIRKEKGKPLEFIVWVYSQPKNRAHTTPDTFPIFSWRTHGKNRKTPEKTQNTEKTTKIVVLLVFVMASQVIVYLYIHINLLWLYDTIYIYIVHVQLYMYCTCYIMWVVCIYIFLGIRLQARYVLIQSFCL